MTDEPTKPEETPDVETPQPEAAVPETEAAPEVEAETLQPEAAAATLGNRVLAFLIDAIIVMAVQPIAGVGQLLGLAYLLTRDGLPFLDGQSIGKKVMKIKAVSSETGSSLSNDWGPCVIRNVVFLIPFFAIVELIVLNGNKEGQRLGDQWAKTKVVVEG
jgi:uncharacterized RDD family membrane protein YckC